MSISPWESLSRAVSALSDRIDNTPSLREATVVSVNPVQVRFDTDTESTVVQGTLARHLRPGDRVLTARIKRYVWVLGTKGGVNDTGWVEITSYQNGFSAGSMTPAYRVIGSVLYLRGDLYRAAAPGVGAAVNAFQLPVGARPSARVWLSTIIWDTRVYVDPSGVVGIYSSTARTSSPGYSITGVTCPTD